MEIGASIACSGACLTVVEKGPGWFAVDVSAETLACTTIGGWKTGSRSIWNSRSASAMTLGGHLVSGHVDAVTTVIERRADGDSLRFSFEFLRGFEAIYRARKARLRSTACR